MRARESLSSVMARKEEVLQGGERGERGDNGEGETKTQNEELALVQDEVLMHLSRMAYHAVEVCLQRLTTSEYSLRQGTDRRQLDNINTALSSYVVSENDSDNGRTPVARLLDQFRVARAQQLYHTKAALDRSDLSHSAQVLGTLCTAAGRYSGYDTSELNDAWLQKSTEWHATATGCQEEADLYRERMMSIRDELARDHGSDATRQEYEDIRKQSLKDVIDHFVKQMPETEAVFHGVSASQHRELPFPPEREARETREGGDQRPSLNRPHMALWGHCRPIAKARGRTQRLISRRQDGCHLPVPRTQDPNANGPP